MARRTGRSAWIAAPIRALLQRFAFLLLLASAVGLILLSRIDRPVVERARALAADVFEPILSAVAQPVSVVNAAIGWVDDILFVHEENFRLRTENARLLQWQEVARRLEQDNASMRRLLAAGPDITNRFVTGRVIADGGGSFVRTALLNIGAKDGVKKGQAVIGEGGYVGRVAEVGYRASRILLLTDLNSRLPVMLQEGGHRAVLTGDNSPFPRLDISPVPPSRPLACTSSPRAMAASSRSAFRLRKSPRSMAACACARWSISAASISCA